MLFYILLYTSLTVCVLGLIYKIATWFTRGIGILSKDFSTTERVAAALKGMLKVLFSFKIFILFKAFLLDVLLQKKILGKNFFLWVMHLLIFGGFMFLLLMHALDNYMVEPFVDEYYSTINPYFFLRDLFGVMVLVGLVMAIYRRSNRKMPRLKTNALDNAAIIGLAFIIGSGIILEGIKISSYTEFQLMVDEYSDLEDEAELKALENLWAEEFGVFCPNVTEPLGLEVMEQGRELHEMNCVDCHASPKWAFTGYTLAKLVTPIAEALDRVGGSKILYYVHIIAVFLGIAFLPFSKMFHVVAVPISILANAVMKKGESAPANILTRQVIELDACTHCGVCSLNCSSMMAFEALKNDCILPSEKLLCLKSISAGREITTELLREIQEGVYICTTCERCTLLCPSGINMKELWVNVREDLVKRGYPEPSVLSPLSFVRGLNRDDFEPEDYLKPIETAKKAVAGNGTALMAHGGAISLNPTPGSPRRQAFGALPFNPKDGTYTFAYCFGCRNCTEVCPVVFNYDNPGEALDLLPNQIMCCLALGLTEMASRSRMIWNCLTCYQCQEHCPQNVQVADILYKLKNLAVRDLWEKKGKDHLYLKARTRHPYESKEVKRV